MKIRILIKELESNGWVLDRVRGSHHVFVHPKAVRSLPVPVHSKEIPDYFAKTILKEAQKALKKETP